jgi:hypothetical protein
MNKFLPGVKNRAMPARRFPQPPLLAIGWTDLYVAFLRG